jgi:transposase InsO family protein
VKFQRDRPNDLWQIDIAGVQSVGTLGKVYLMAILDDCSRFVVAARYFRDQSGANVIRLLRAAFEAHGLPNQLLADNGTQFKNVIGDLGTRYARLLHLLGVEPIFSRPHHPQTKGKLERWFGTVRAGFLLEVRAEAAAMPGTTLTELNERLEAWVKWYNAEKPHRSLPGRCPPASVFLSTSARIYRPLETAVDWDRWTCAGTSRKVTKYNAVSYKGASIAIPPGYAGCQAEVRDFGNVVEVYYHETLLASFPLEFGTGEAGPDRVSRRVAKNGTIRYKKQYYTVGYKLAGKVVQVQEAVEGTVLLVYLGQRLVKKLEIKIS